MRANPLKKLQTDHEVLKRKVERLSASVSEIGKTLSPPDPWPTIKIAGSEVEIRKAIITPVFTNKIVLTDSTWEFVDIFLKNSKNREAVNYWRQAKNFYLATLQLDILARPLTTYYCFLNATKALLKYKKIGFAVKHGVSGSAQSGHKILQNEIVKLKPSGVASGLANYLKETITAPEESFTFKQILYNLEYIHRAFQLTYKTGYPELFVPVYKPRYVFDRANNEGWLEVQLDQKYQATAKKSLTGFSIDKRYREVPEVVRRNKKFTWETRRNVPTQASLTSFHNYYLKTRKQFRYIYSPTDLWYIKRSDLTNNIIDKSSLVLTFVAMHRLSEQSRYDPNSLENLLSKSEGWLIAEFINKSLVQFIDMISAEITGDDFRLTGFRV